MPKLTAELLDAQCLTPRESQIALLVCEGVPDKLIAKALAISVKTLSCHLEHIYYKLQVKRESINSRCAAISTLVARGMVRVSVQALLVLLLAGVSGYDRDGLLLRHVRPGALVVRLRGHENV